MARSGSADGVMMSEFLPEVSAMRFISGSQERKSLPVSDAPVRMTASTSSWEMSALPASPSSV